MSFAKNLIQFIQNSTFFINQYSRWIPPRIVKTLRKCNVNPSIGVIQGDAPRNQFVAVWDTIYDELRPFGFNVNDFSKHNTQFIEWVFPFTDFKYSTNYCSIDHLKVVNTLAKTVKDKATFLDSKLADVEFHKSNVTSVLQNGEKISSKIFVDGCGYASVPNSKAGCNRNSPIYQMLIWKYPIVHNLSPNINNIWYKPAKLYNELGYNPNDRVAGWFHPLSDGFIIGASKYLYQPWPWDKLVKYLKPYLENYIQIEKLIPEGKCQEFKGIGVLYNPNHKLSINRLLQLGDARRISRPCTGYGFIPALWHGLFGAIATILAFQKNSFSHNTLDNTTMFLFNRLVQLNYSWEYIMQLLYMNGNWSNTQFVFETVNEVLSQVAPGFMDRLTLARFTRDDINTGLKYFLKRIMQNPKFILSLPIELKIKFLKYLIKNRLLNWNKAFLAI